MRYLLSLFTAAVLALTATPAIAQTLIGFEGVTEGTPITDYYSGLTFYLAGDGASRDPVIAVENTGDPANRFAYIAGGTDDLTPHGAALLSDGGTSDSSHYGAYFDAAVSEVTLQFMDFGDCVAGKPTGADITVGLTAFNGLGGVVDSDSITVPYRSLPDGSSLTLHVEGSGIVQVETWGDPDCGNGIDEFRFVLEDSDDDGVPDAEDACPDSMTDVDAGVPSVRLGTNRWADTDDDGVFETKAPKGNGPQLSFDLEDTAGCYCADIIAAMELGAGHTKFGCSISAMQDWIGQLP